MIHTFPALLFAVLYSLLLFAVAWKAERNQQWLQRGRPLVYSLALAVYCSSWTFFGAVGQATTNLWSFLPIYLGPTLVLLFGHRFLQKLMLAGEQQKVTSIADFIGSRFGKSQVLSALVTVCALAGSLPYIALQLRAVTMAWETISPNTRVSGLDTAFIAALLLCVFAIVFGTRNLEGRERNRGMVTAIALESVIKLLGFAAVAVIAVLLLLSTPNTIAPQSFDPGWTVPLLNTNFFTQTLLASVAIFCLPRQFHMAVVEYRNRDDLRTARWLLPLYLLAFSLLVLPIAIAGRELLSGVSYRPDTLALLLPAFGGWPAFSVVAFIGGLSAATGMVIVASITLSVMISNELVAPLWLRLSRNASASAAAFGTNLKLIRRISITLILLLAWQVNRVLISFSNLADLGLLAFAASGQFAPALISGLYWKQAHRKGVVAGLITGYVLWFYCLILPALFPDMALMQSGPFGITWLRPLQLFGLAFPDPLSHGVFWSLLCNSALLVLVSLCSSKQVNDRVQADAFVNAGDESREGSRDDSSDLSSSTIKVKQLRALLNPFIGRARLETLWRGYEQRLNQRLLDDDLTPKFIVEDTERTLAGIVGSATAQKVLALLHRKGPLQLEDIARLVDDTSRELRFSQDILQTTVETVSQGISVVDADLKLVAWNSRYQQLFGYPLELLYIGCPIVELFRLNAERGMYGENAAEVEIGIANRMQLYYLGSAHQFERKLLDGTIVEVRSNPMPGGGFVTTYTDITHYRGVVAALEDSKSTLEERVQQRTHDLSVANESLQVENERRAEAETKLHDLHASKTRFLAYTSHDLMQPLNAARLFVGALQQQNAPNGQLIEDLDNVSMALDNASELVEALREISRLDSGSMKPQPEYFRVDAVLAPLVAEFRLTASEKKLALHHANCSAVIFSDRHLLRRILQNLLSNALHYTQQGSVLIGCRRRAGLLEIQVWDTGPGIDDDAMEAIFDEFVRLDRPGDVAGKGLGLGLAIARRSAALLGHSVRALSRSGKGSLFTVSVKRGDAAQLPSLQPEPIRTEGLGSLDGLKVLCVDNDPAILAGMHKLLSSWGCEVDTALDQQAAMALVSNNADYDILILDYHLDHNLDGIDCYQSLCALFSVTPHTVMISADTSESVRSAAREHNMLFLAKPVKPAALLNLLRVRSRQLGYSEAP